MAAFGCKHPCFRPHGASQGVVIGKLVSANLSVTLANGEFYADDELTEEVSEFVKGSVAMETDEMADNVASVVYGASVANGELVDKTGDSAPEGDLAYYKSLMKDGVKYYRGFYYPCAKAALGNDNIQTKGSNITFQTENTAFTVKQDENGNWRYRKRFSDEASALAWVESKTGIGTAHRISVSVQNAGSDKSVDKVGEFYVAAGESFTLNITGYASVTQAYDNGTSVKTAITGGSGTYTLNNVSADHDIVIIF